MSYYEEERDKAIIASLKEIGSQLKQINEAISKEQSEGEWVDKYQGKYDNQLYKCSECGETAFHDVNRWFLTHYCPNCGAKMKGAGNE